jgi:hypothetical protein
LGDLIARLIDLREPIDEGEERERDHIIYVINARESRLLP